MVVFRHSGCSVPVKKAKIDGRMLGGEDIGFVILGMKNMRLRGFSVPENETWVAAFDEWLLLGERNARVADYF